MGWAEENNIKALCFDIDGTLYPKWQTDLYLFFSAFRHPVFSVRYNSMRQKMRAQDGYKADRMLSLAGFRAKEKQLMGWKGSDEEWIETYERKLLRPWEKSMARFIHPFPYVRESLEAARARGFFLAALSDFPLSGKLSILGLDDCFDWKASTEDTGYLKPCNQPFIYMLREIGIRPEEALYVGDSYKKDVVGASKVGMRTLLIRKGADKASFPLADLVLTSWQTFANIVI